MGCNKVCGDLTLQWLGGSDKRSVWGIHIPYRFPIQWGAVRSYLKFPNHLVVKDG